jgi:hypothetical protein
MTSELGGGRVCTRTDTPPSLAFSTLSASAGRLPWSMASTVLYASTVSMASSVLAEWSRSDRQLADSDPQNKAYQTSVRFIRPTAGRLGSAEVQTSKSMQAVNLVGLTLQILSCRCQKEYIIYSGAGPKACVEIEVEQLAECLHCRPSWRSSLLSYVALQRAL